jgi:hypothetical protein
MGRDHRGVPSGAAAEVEALLVGKLRQGEEREEVREGPLSVRAIARAADGEAPILVEAARGARIDIARFL